MECIKWKSYEKGTLLGFADFWMEKWGCEIRGCTLHKKDNATWVNMPSREFEIDGEMKYANIVHFREKPHAQEFSRQAKAAIAKWRDENGV